MKAPAKLHIRKYQNLSQEDINNKFVGACCRSDVDLLEFIVNHPDINKPDFEKIKSQAFFATISQGDLNTYRFLLFIYKESPPVSFGTVLSRNIPELNEYFIPKIDKDKAKAHLSGVIRFGDVQQLKVFLNFHNIEVTPDMLKENWAYGGHRCTLWLLENKVQINQEFYEWAKTQTVNCMKICEHFMQSYLLKKSLENSLEEKSTTKIKKI